MLWAKEGLRKYSFMKKLYMMSDLKQFRMVGRWHGNREVAKGGWKVGQSFSKVHLPFNGPVNTFIEYSPFSKLRSFMQISLRVQSKVEKFPTKGSLECQLVKLA